MESITLVDRLKIAIENDFKGLKEEFDELKTKCTNVQNKNDDFQRTNKEVVEDNLRLTKALKELKVKYECVYGKLKRRQEEIKKKEKWWDKYRFTAETLIKKLRTQGKFSSDILHEVSRDLIDIMEETSPRESCSSQEKEERRNPKLTTSKEGKKKFRYSDISPENLTKKPQPELKKEFNYPNSKSTVETLTRNDENSVKEKDKNPHFSEQNSQKEVLVKIESIKPTIRSNNGTNTDTFDRINDVGFPSLTSTPTCVSSQEKTHFFSVAMPDLSIISRENICIIKKECPTISPSKSRSELQDLESKDIIVKNNRKATKGSPQKLKRLGKKLNVIIPDINKLKEVDQCNKNSQSIITNQIELKGKYDDTELNPNSPSILEFGLGGEKSAPSVKDQGNQLHVNGTKRKRKSENMDNGKNGKERQSKGNLLRSSRDNIFKVAAKFQPISYKPNKLKKSLAENESVVLLLSDEEEEEKMGSSSIDMFGSSYKGQSKDISNEQDMINMIDSDNMGKMKKKSISSVVKRETTDEENASKLLDEEFPGFRKPDEPTYKNVEVVRKKDRRAKLNGFSCRECEQYYGALNLPENELKKRMKECSRHRSKFSPPPSTPPGFWNLSFPDTEEYEAQGHMKTGDQVPPLKPRRIKRRRILQKPV